MSHNLSSEVANARVEYTTFEPKIVGMQGGERVTDETVVPVHVVKEWQWPSLKSREAQSGEPIWRTTRISEWRWPLRGTYLCDLKPDIDSVNDGWPDPGEAEDRATLISVGLVMPWQWYPLCDVGIGVGCLWADDATWITHNTSVCRPYRNDGLPDDYLEFWLDAETELYDEVNNVG